MPMIDAESVARDAGSLQVPVQAKDRMGAPPRATVLRCGCCGDVIEFNALAVRCHCLDECYDEQVPSLSH